MNALRDPLTVKLVLAALGAIGLALLIGSCMSKEERDMREVFEILNQSEPSK